MITFVLKKPAILVKMEGKEGIEALFLHATEGILVVSERGEIIRINPSAERLFGYNSGELIGKSVESLVPKRLTPEHTAHREKYNHNPHARSMGIGMELFGQKKDGSEIPVEISLSPYSTSAGKFTIAFIVDITHRRVAEEKLKNYSSELEQQVKNRTLILEEAIRELEKTKKELKIALDKEKELNELKSRFVSMASHEFRTPLATIQSSLSLVKKYGEINEIEKQDKHIAKIKSAIGNLTDILNDFLSVSKLEEGRVELLIEKFSLEPFIAGVISEMQPIAKKGQRIMHAHTGAETAELDKKLLKNILINLLTNAIKFSPEGKNIEINSEAAPGEVKVSIRDYGIGISKEDQEHLSERFFRGHNATHIQGTGLGLNIVSKYMERMGGKLSVSSKLNKGTVFTIIFPQ